MPIRTLLDDLRVVKGPAQGHSSTSGIQNASGSQTAQDHTAQLSARVSECTSDVHVHSTVAIALS